MNLDESKINVTTTNHIGVKVLKIRTEKKIRMFVIISLSVETKIQVKIMKENISFKRL